MCMELRAVGFSEERYWKITYNYTMALASTLYQINLGMIPHMFLSRAPIALKRACTIWARVKWKTENYILKMGYKQAFMFRPGIIIPLRAIRSSTKLYQFFYDYFLWLIKIIKALATNLVVNTKVGLSMISCTIRG